MAIVRFDGKAVRCVIVGEKDGMMICRSLEHAPRLTMGTRFAIPAGDLIRLDEPEELAATAAGQQALDAAMAKERETLPTPQQVMKDNPTIAPDAPGKAEST